MGGSNSKSKKVKVLLFVNYYSNFWIYTNIY